MVKQTIHSPGGKPTCGATFNFKIPSLWPKPLNSGVRSLSASVSASQHVDNHKHSPAYMLPPGSSRPEPGSRRHRARTREERLGRHDWVYYQRHQRWMQHWAWQDKAIWRSSASLARAWSVHYWCEYQGKPQVCRSYNNNPLHYYRQIMWDLRKLPNACKGQRVLKPLMCRRASDEAQMVFKSASSSHAEPMEWPYRPAPRQTCADETTTETTRAEAKAY